MDLEQLKEDLKGALGTEDPAKRELAAAVIADYTALQARSLAGEDVASEIGHVEAQALNLTAEAQQKVQDVLTAFWQKLVQATVAALLTA